MTSWASGPEPGDAERAPATFPNAAFAEQRARQDRRARPGQPSLDAERARTPGEGRLNQGGFGPAGPGYGRPASKHYDRRS